MPIRPDDVPADVALPPWPRADDLPADARQLLAALAGRYAEHVLQQPALTNNAYMAWHRIRWQQYEPVRALLLEGGLARELGNKTILTAPAVAHLYLTGNLDERWTTAGVPDDVWWRSHAAVLRTTADELLEQDPVGALAAALVIWQGPEVAGAWRPRMPTGAVELAGQLEAAVSAPAAVRVLLTLPHAPVDELCDVLHGVLTGP